MRVKPPLPKKYFYTETQFKLTGSVRAKAQAAHAKIRLDGNGKTTWYFVSTTSVMQFPYNNCLVNLLDTPGHEDFSEDTYRTLTAVDSCLW